MRNRAKQLMEFLWCNKAEPATFDLDATEFLNPGTGEPSTLVLAPDRHGRQIIVDRMGDEKQTNALAAGHWRVWAEVVGWSVKVEIQSETLPAYPDWLPASSTGSGVPDPVGHFSERYLELGASRQGRSTISFPEAVLAAEFTTELWAVLAEHGAGVSFKTTMLARTLLDEGGYWSVTRQESLEPVLLQESRGPMKEPQQTDHRKRGRS